MKILYICCFLWLLSIPLTGQHIVSAEYFWNVDPGVGKGEPLSLNSENLQRFDIPTAGLTPGIHILHIRIKSSAGYWSTYVRSPIHVIKDQPQEKIVAYQWSFDNPPSNDVDNTVAISPTYEVSLQIDLPTIGLSAGSHEVYMRIKDEANNWSPPKMQSFSIQDCPPGNTRLSEQALAEVLPGQSVEIDLEEILNSKIFDFSILSAPIWGTATVSDGILTFTAPLGTVGRDSLQYESCNECDACSKSWLYFEILNVAPEITKYNYTLKEGKQVLIPFSTLVSDVNNNIDYSSFTVIDAPLSGAGITLQNSFDLLIDYEQTDFSGEDTFTIQICDEAGACSEQRFHITVKKGEKIVVYNAVSPNGDGRNDYLEISNIGAYPDNRLVIINRWGDKVYEARGYDNVLQRFDGRSNVGGSSHLPSGTYFYELHLDSEAKNKLNGFILLKH